MWSELPTNAWWGRGIENMEGCIVGWDAGNEKPQGKHNQDSPDASRQIEPAPMQARVVIASFCRTDSFICRCRRRVHARNLRRTSRPVYQVVSLPYITIRTSAHRYKKRYELPNFRNCCRDLILFVSTISNFSTVWNSMRIR